MIEAKEEAAQEVQEVEARYESDATRVGPRKRKAEVEDPRAPIDASAEGGLGSGVEHEEV